MYRDQLKPEKTDESPQQSLEGHSRHRNRRSAWLVGAVLLVAAGIFFFQRQSMGRAADVGMDPTSPGVPIVTAVARKADIGVYIEALGTVTPVYTVTVTSRVSGQIMNVSYQEGQMVHKGDSLLEIDARPYQAALTEAQGQLAHDQAVLNEARIDLQRYKEALDRNAIAKQQYDDQEQIVIQDEGSVMNDEGVVENAKVNLVYCHIASPIDGRVGLRLVDPGNIVQANSTTAMVVITQLEPITVVFSIAEDYLSEIEQQLHQGTLMAVDAFDREQEKEIATGSLLTLDNLIDTSTGTLKLKAIFPNADNALFPSQFVNVKLLVDTRHGEILIPTPAVQRNAQGVFVYVIKPDHTAAIRAIKLGTANADVTAVEGIQAGEVVAINGFDKLQDGIKVAASSGPEDARAGQGGGN